MNLKFWKKKSKEQSAQVVAIPLATLMQWYFYDMGIEKANEISVKNGIVPPSTDVVELEVEASNKRMSRLYSLMPFVDAVAQLNAAILSEVQMHSLEEKNPEIAAELDTKIKDLIYESYSTVSLHAVASAFSSAMELGLIVEGPTIMRGMKEVSIDHE